MGTVIVNLEPSVPAMQLVCLRDVAPGRPWQPPARHWPELPLIGGRDELAGGTWLAIHPAIPRVACVLNGRGQHAPQPFRRSRGDLPLRAGAGGRPALDDLGRRPRHADQPGPGPSPDHQRRAGPDEAPDGWAGISSVSYVAFSPAGLRYDFQPVPGQLSAVSATR